MVGTGVAPVGAAGAAVGAAGAGLELLELLKKFFIESTEFDTDDEKAEVNVLKER